ncbi:hypothetical protein DFH08DRAFT_961853 [Mycena albidolilacea]|uniref:Uncharacterized protein n=1 Tax=Mycena albidolilacea TaxID=1033008 RepID=A0AAD7A0C0_9AGAR|nr:hypothetical protein DFH08DRAFT_961853 [Mycena albidolilacea]
MILHDTCCPAALLLARCRTPARPLSLRLHPHPHLHPLPSLCAPRSACLPTPAHPAGLGCSRLHILHLHPCPHRHRHPCRAPLLAAPCTPLPRPLHLPPPPSTLLPGPHQPAAQSLVTLEYPAEPILQGVDYYGQMQHRSTKAGTHLASSLALPLPPAHTLLFHSRSPHCSTLPLPAVPPLPLHLLLISVVRACSHCLFGGLNCPQLAQTSITPTGYSFVVASVFL